MSYMVGSRRLWALGFGVGLGLMGATAARADTHLPGGPSLCRANFGDSGGQDATFELETNRARSNADGGAATENSSFALVGVDFTPTISFPATLTMGVSYAGLLVGSLDINTIYGKVLIRVTLRDVTDGVDMGTQVILDQTEDGNPFETIFNLVDSFPGASATFTNVDLIRDHEYTVTLRVDTAAKGLQGRADFKSGNRSVSFGCVAITPELVDSDGDGLYDVWEEDGIDVDGDGTVDINLPAFGARPDHKDLFVEMDWRPGRQPSRAGILALKDAFAEAPADAGGTTNPDGTLGIKLWVDTGGLMEAGLLVGDDLGGGGDVLPDPVVCLDQSFYDARRDFFDPDRLLAFRYLVSGDSAENTCADGRSVGGKGEVGGNDFIVYNEDPGFIIHELGHNLNLRHGGFENLNNKPNYVSMMNYNYGLSIPQISGGGIIDYAPPRCATCPGDRGAIPGPLDETQLDETAVLDPNDVENMFQFRDLAAITTGWAMNGQDTDGDNVNDVDWTGDGTISGSPVTVDINEDGKCVSPGPDGNMDSTPGGDDVLLSDGLIHDGPNRECDTTANPASDDVQSRPVGADQPDDLLAHDDWSAIVLNPREFGDSAEAAINPAQGERSLQEWRAVDEVLNTTDLALTKGDSPDPVNAGEPLVYTLTVTNHGPQPARGIRVIDMLPLAATYLSDSAGCVEAPAGILTCELATLLRGESFSFDIAVVVDPDDVADLPAPVIIENVATVDNKVPYGLNGHLGEVGGDPDLSDNLAAELTAVNRPPIADPNGPYVEECQGVETTVALDGSASYDPDGDPITYAWVTDCPGGVFDDPTAVTPTLTLASPPPCPVVCSVELTVTDPGGLSDTKATSVMIIDTTPPTITVHLTPSELSVPNHEMRTVTATVTASDICDPSPAVTLTSIVSNEPDDAPGEGDGHTVNDIQGASFGAADFQFQLRAERAGQGAGRTYTVTYTATDTCGLSTEGTATVLVPHN